MQGKRLQVRWEELLKMLTKQMNFSSDWCSLRFVISNNYYQREWKQKSCKKNFIPCNAFEGEYSLYWGKRLASIYVYEKLNWKYLCFFINRIVQDRCNYYLFIFRLPSIFYHKCILSLLPFPFSQPQYMFVSVTPILHNLINANTIICS